MITGNGYHTHYPFLAAALASRTTGPVLELGAGDWSTVMLHYMCEAQHRLLVTAESDADWLSKYHGLATSRHHLHHVPQEEWHTYPVAPPSGEPARWGVVFVDCYPSKARGPLIERVRPYADLIVAHDTEMPEVNGYEPVLSSFAHRADFKLVTPWTTIVSDVAPIW
jgi:hypothetical protein